MDSALRIHLAPGGLSKLSVVAVSIIGIIGLWASIAQAVPDQIIFGPKQYLRGGTGTVTEYNDTISVPSNIGPPFLLHIVNGQSNGKNRVSSAWITINNIQVAGQTDFGQNVAVVDRSITLNPGTNHIGVKVGSTKGSYLTITIYGTKIPPTPTSLTPNPLNLTVGSTGALTATIGPPPTAPGTLTVASSNSGIATIPSSVAFAANQTSIPIPVTAVAAGNASISVSLSGGTISATVAVSEAPATIASLLPTTQTLTQGSTGILTVTLNAAHSTSTTVNLSSSASGIVFVPGTVVIPAGQISVPITVSANTPGTATIAASLNGTSASSVITVTPNLPTIVSLLPTTTSVNLGATGSLTVTISAVQPSATTIQVSASPTGIVTVPATVTVPAGQLTTTVPFTATALGTAMVHVSLNSSMAESALQVTPPPPAVVSLLPSPLPLVVGANGTLTVTLNAGQLVNTAVTVTVDAAGVVQVPAVVTVPAGQTQANFTVTGLAVGSATVSASLNGSAQNAVVHVQPPPPQVISLLPNPLPIQQGATGSLVLTINAAQLNDTVIALTNSASTIVTVPPTVTVPANQLTATIPVTAVLAGSATITAAINGSIVSTVVSVSPPPPVVTSLNTIPPDPGGTLLTRPKGKPGSLRVTLSRAPTNATVVSLTSSATNVAQVPASVTVAAGSLTGDFPVNTVGEGTTTISATLNGGSASATVIVTPAELVLLMLSPKPLTLFVGETQSMMATGTFTDGSTQNLTTDSHISWTSTDTTVATITSSGFVQAMAVGGSTLRAAYTPASSAVIIAESSLTVLTPPALTLTPATATLGVGQSVNFTVGSTQAPGPGGLVVILGASGTGAVMIMPPSVTIPEGQTTAASPVAVTGSAIGAVTLTATAPVRTPASASITVVLSGPPGTLSFTPVQGKLGTYVTITGNNFDSTTSANQVTIGGVTASVQSATATQLVVNVPAGALSGPIRVTTTGGTTQSAASFSVVAITSVSVSPGQASVPVGLSQAFRATATFADQTTLDVTGLTTWMSSNTGIVSIAQTGIAQGAAAGTATVTGTLVGFTGTASVQAVANTGIGSLPPDPSTVAPPLNRTVATPFALSTSFLYSGANPIQTGVAAGTIVSKRAAVIRGAVKGRDGWPILGVTVRILSHPELGQTLTRGDGMFDLAVNGGGLLTVDYQKNGFMPVQRSVQVPWHDFVSTPETVMIAFDPQVTAVNASAPTVQIAEGTPQTDASGTRQARVLFMPGTTATMVMPNGTTQPLNTMSIRATEYTVGPTGPQAMPAVLPPASGYTYAVELSADEASAANAVSVQFNQPVFVYLDNFLNLPVGTQVPVGSYDRMKATWVPSPDGKIIKILSVTAGAADVDTDGDGTADNSGITLAERQAIATRYAAGKTIWRAGLMHFTPCDLNFPLVTDPPNAPSAAVDPPTTDEQEDEPECEEGSIIYCENESLGERVSLTGTPYRLYYHGASQRGRIASNQLKVQLSGATPPTGVQRIDLEIDVAGKVITQTFPPLANQQLVYTWDGKDVYGRPAQGKVPVATNIIYYYNAIVGNPSQPSPTFNLATSVPLNPPIGSRIQAPRTRTFLKYFGVWDSQSLGLGGWELNVHHTYDPSGNVVHLGNGRIQTASGLRLANVKTIAGGNGSGFAGDGGPAINAKFHYIQKVIEAPDGSLYVLDSDNHRVRRIDANGIVNTVVGNGAAGFGGDGGPATAAQLNQPLDLALGPDGSLYIADWHNHRIRKVTPDGIIRTIAGTGVGGFSGDGGSALLANIKGPNALALAPNGDLYIGDGDNLRIRLLRTDGTIQTVAGNGLFTSAITNDIDGMNALNVALDYIQRIALAPDGSLYMIDWSRARVYKVGLDGLLRIVAGIGQPKGYSGDGGPAVAAQLDNPLEIFVDKDSTIYLADSGDFYLRKISPNGIISTVLVSAGASVTTTKDHLISVDSIWRAQDGQSFYIGDAGGDQVVKIGPPRQGADEGDVFISSEDGREIYRFNAVGRHLQTLDSLTNAVRYQFAYTSDGFLSSVTDLDGKITTIERDGSGNATAIVAPGGQLTTLTMEANGYLAAISNPQNETMQFTYSPDGLMATLKDPVGNNHAFVHDALGRLSRDQDPASGFKTLVRTEQVNGWTASVTSGLNRTTSYQVENLVTGNKRWTQIDPNGLISRSATGLPDVGTDSVRSYTVPDGTITTQILTQDPRFGMQAPLVKSLTVQTPLGLTSTTTQTRTVTLSNPVNPFTMTSLADNIQINGRQYQRLFDQASKTITTTTPQGRVILRTLDAKGRIAQQQVTGFEAVTYTYDGLGRLSTTTQGTGVSARTTTFVYNSKNELIGITDPLLRNIGFEYTLAGRLSKKILPDLREILYSYDANGNVTGITPPGRPLHQFQYTPVNLESNYNPPDLGFAPRHTQYAYNLDRQLTTITRPDGQSVQLDYEPTGGRFRTLTLPGSLVTTYAYDPTKGTLNTITAPGSTLAYTYDGSLLKQTTWSGAVAGSESRNYDSNFRMSSQSVNGSNTIDFGYDNDSLLTSVGALTISRNSQNGLIIGTTLATVSDVRSYNTFGELNSYQATSTGNPVFSATYQRDKLGRITQKTEVIGGLTTTYDYGYDQAGRLQEVKTNGSISATYGYDSNGNRVSYVTPLVSLTASVDAQDRLTTYGQLQFTYTTNGELLNKSNPTLGQTATYTYDVLGNLKAAALPGGVTIEYVVDGQNRRIGKKVNGTLTQGMLYQNQLNPVAELDGTGAIVSRFVYGTKSNIPDYMIKNGVTYRIVSDHLGSPRLIINTADGSVAARIDYDEFGTITQDTNPGFQPFGFAGGLYDQHTGLTRFGARDYDAQIGRWTAKDRIGFKGNVANLYAYGAYDPVNYVDPDGLVGLWREGSSPGEPFAHQSVGFGDPNGSNFTLSFGWEEGSLLGGTGAVYPDTQKGGEIFDYYEVSPYDAIGVFSDLNAMYGQQGSYNLLTNNCRHFVSDTLSTIIDRYGLEKTAPPARDSTAPGNYALGPSSSITTDRSGVWSSSPGPTIK